MGDEERNKHGSKLIAIRDTLRAIHANSDDRAIVFIQWSAVQAALHKALKAVGVAVHVLSGGVAQRNKVLAAFGAEPKSVLLLSLENSPSGMNLICANHCLLVHPMFSDSVDEAVAWERQAIGRICRQGQEKPCHIYRFATKNTIEAELFAQQHGGGDGGGGGGGGGGDGGGS